MVTPSVRPQFHASSERNTTFDRIETTCIFSSPRNRYESSDTDAIFYWTVRWHFTSSSSPCHANINVAFLHSNKGMGQPVYPIIHILHAHNITQSSHFRIISAQPNSIILHLIDSRSRYHQLISPNSSGFKLLIEIQYLGNLETNLGNLVANSSSRILST